MKKGNLELRSRCGKYEIIYWQDNEYYGKQSEYIFDGDWYKKTLDSNHYISPSCFENPKFCCTIAFIEAGVPDFIDERPLELKDNELRDFLKLLILGIKKSKKSKK